MRKRIRKYFPMDFYGDYQGWRFIIRAENANEVLPALMWRAHISIHRKKFNLFQIATETFPYTLNSFALENQAEDFGSNVKMLGPIVEVQKLNQTNKMRPRKVIVP